MIALDNLLNTLLRGRPGQTLSQRSETARQDGRKWGCILCWILDKIEKDHCKNAVYNDFLRAQQVILDTEDRHDAIRGRD